MSFCRRSISFLSLVVSGLLSGWCFRILVTPTRLLGLRAFFIDSSNQGKGYGKAAAMELKPYLVREYSSYSSIALTVNGNNPAAYKCYLGAGFEDTGALYQGGKAGPQHIMRMELAPANKNF